MICAFCGRDIIKKLPIHLRTAHGKTLRDNTIINEGLDPNNLPKCKFCGRDVMIDRIVHKTCDNPMCIERQKAINRHEGQVIENRRRVEAGTSNLLKQNLQYDEFGRSLIHLNSYRSRMIHGNLQPKISNLEKRVADYVRTRYPRVTIQYGIPGAPDPHPYDMYVPEINLLIEVDGSYWHEQKSEWDYKCEMQAKNLGYNIERISWDENQNISDEQLASMVDTILDKYPVGNQQTYFPASPPESTIVETR